MDNKYESSLLMPQSRHKDKCKDNKCPSCDQLSGTILRIFIPPGTVINLLNLIEVSSPSGICIIVRIPLLAGNSSKPNNFSFENIISAIEKFGGSVEVMSE